MVAPLPTPIKGDADWRTYKAIRLDNGMTVVLVHDENSKHFACANSVSVGASCDPRELSGLAHFTEHMCFLGSEEYPRENEYKQYLSKHGGRSNASTSLSHTTYQFEVLAEDEVALKALDIFVHFFVNPLFTKSGTQREVQAVDSENSKNKSTDGRRRLQILKALGDQSHHYCKFTTGDRHTLPAADVEDTAYGDEVPAQSNDPQLQNIIKEINDGEKCTKRDEANLVREAVLAFHKRHYYPERMVAVLVGPQSLEKLETWAIERFSKVIDRREIGMPNDDDDKMRMLATRLVDRSANDAPPVSILSSDVEYMPAFRPDVQGTWPVLLTTKPLSDMRKLVVYFPVPPTYSTPDNSPTSMLSHLLGHEGVGSAYAFLQDAGLITGISSGSRINAPDQNLFQVQISLTESGERSWADVVKVVFDYAEMLCKASSSDDAGNDDLTRIWDEVSRLNRMTFNQRSPGAAYSFAPSLAQSVSKFGTEASLSAGLHLRETLSMEHLHSFCKRIVPSNCFVERCSKNAWNEIEESDSNSPSDGPYGLQTEKWYGVDFFLTPIDDKINALWAGPKHNASHLLLPNPNQYIPRSLELCADLPEEAKSPRIEKAIDPPVLLENSPEGRLWWRLDDRYALPKSSLTVLFRTTKAEHKRVHLDGGAAIYDYDHKSAQLSNLLTSIFHEATAQSTYDAHLAGLGFSLSKSSSGFTLTVSGYSDRLSDYAKELLTNFCSSDFIGETQFASCKDGTVRSLRSFHESKRADSIAIYYRDLLVSGKGEGVEKSLATVEQISLDDVISHHHDVFSDSDSKLEVLYTGNVSQDQAAVMFDAAKNIVRKRRSVKADVSSDTNTSWEPGPLERRLPPGEDIEIHFQSRNVKEENGAVIVTFQSQGEGFKGGALSTEESLKRSAAIRLISRIVREPFFTQLRTEQQLGYIVSSFYESGYSTRQAAYFASNPAAMPHSTSIDSLSMYVLSKKVEPTEIAKRVDDFLVEFRDRLVDQSEEELDKHAESLAKLLTKPTRKLGSEASSHMSKIRRYSPELFSSRNENDAVKSMPWDSAQILAGAVRGLKKEDIVSAWDSLVVNSESTKITSLVYGTKHPLEPGLLQGKSLTTMEGLLKKRSTLKPFGPCETSHQGLSFLLRRKSTLCFAVLGAAAVVTVGAAVMSRHGRQGNDQKTK